MVSKTRIDQLLVSRGLAESRQKAQAMIMAGQVIVNDHAVEKSGLLVDDDSDIRVRGDSLPYVGRGGLKLKAALDRFIIDVTGVVAIDVGASTGGFTDCLLQSGARKVYAVDVGYGQLAWKLRTDPRVLVMEKTNIRHLEPESLDEIPDMAVIDASFISLAKVLPHVSRLISPAGGIVALVKPQFEVGRGRVGKGGVVRDADTRNAAVESVISEASMLGLELLGRCESPITGADGNHEYLIYLRKSAKESNV